MEHTLDPYGGGQHKKKRVFRVLLGGFLLFCLTFFLLAYQIWGVFENNAKLYFALSGEQESVVSLEELIPFSWDEMYAFPPHTPRAEMEGRTGVKSMHFLEIKEENYLQYYFLHKGEVVCGIYGSKEELGFLFDFDYLAYGQGQETTVERVDDRWNVYS